MTPHRPLVFFCTDNYRANTSYERDGVISVIAIKADVLVLTNTQAIMAFLGIPNDCAFKGALSAARKVPLNWEQELRVAEAKKVDVTLCKAELSGSAYTKCP